MDVHLNFIYFHFIWALVRQYCLSPRYPVRAVLPDILDDDECGDNIINFDLSTRRQRAANKGRCVLETAYWVKITAECMGKLPMMSSYADKVQGIIQQQRKQEENADLSSSLPPSHQRGDSFYFDRYFANRGYIIQQYQGHSVLKCIGAVKVEKNEHCGIPIVFDVASNKLKIGETESVSLISQLPTALLAKVAGFCDFQTVRVVLSRVSCHFRSACELPSCYSTATVPTVSLHRMLEDVRCCALC